MSWKHAQRREQSVSPWVCSRAPLQLCNQCKKTVLVSESGTQRTNTSGDILPWRNALVSSVVWCGLPLSVLCFPSEQCPLEEVEEHPRIWDPAAFFHPRGVFPDSPASVVWIMSRNWWAQVRCWTPALPHEFPISFASELSWLMEALPFFSSSVGDVCLKWCARLCREVSPWFSRTHCLWKKN